MMDLTKLKVTVNMVAKSRACMGFCDCSVMPNYTFNNIG